MNYHVKRLIPWMKNTRVEAERQSNTHYNITMSRITVVSVIQTIQLKVKQNKAKHIGLVSFLVQTRVDPLNLWGLPKSN